MELIIELYGSALPKEILINFFQLEDVGLAEQMAAETGRRIYTWKTVGRSNWLEARLSIVDSLGLILLPHGFPDFIEMPDDSNEDD